MHRVPTIAVAYFAACLCGAVIFSLGWALYESSLSTLLPAVIFGLIGGSMLAFPCALPVIILSETTKRLGAKSFALVGVVTGSFLAVLVSSFLTRPIHALNDLAVVGSLILSSTTFAALTYWYVAWRVDPPMGWE